MFDAQVKPTSARDLATFLAACIDGEAIDPQLRQALQMTQRERFHVSEKFGQAMAWENVHLNDVDVVDKPAGLNNATACVGLVPAHKAGIVLLANRGDFPYEIARYRVLPELAREE
jgi:beta-lactamase class C